MLNALGDIAQIVAAFASVAALLIALQANQLANKTRSESYEQQEKSHQLEREIAEKNEKFSKQAADRERLRDQREIASNMQAWWVYRETEYGKQWGIVLSTTGPVNSVFFDVRLTVLNKGEEQREKIAMVPPGQYFIPSVFKESKYSTGQPVLDKPKLISAEEIEKYQPLLHAANYVVKQIEFRDQLGQQWLWTLKEGLTSL
ncbi:hypothetical protein [Corynebacterium resistens]|nr:hypothetical protein [Corynebacterium resistens]